MDEADWSMSGAAFKDMQIALILSRSGKQYKLGGAYRTATDVHADGSGLNAMKAHHILHNHDEGQGPEDQGKGADDVFSGRLRREDAGPKVQR